MEKGPGQTGDQLRFLHGCEGEASDGRGERWERAMARHNYSRHYLNSGPWFGGGHYGEGENGRERANVGRVGSGGG